MVSLYELMQMAVDAIPQSPHPNNKIAATLALPDTPINDAVTATNYWPVVISEKIGTQQRIGNASGTLHAETACILKASVSKDANLFITDPPCPNCAKNIAEAGIKNLYIDHKGFLKDFAKRRGEAFKTMSMRVFEAAGISVYEIYRKEQKTVAVYEAPSDYVPVSEFPVHVHASDETFEEEIIKAKQIYKDEPFALCIAHNAEGQNFILHAQRHPTIGYTHLDDLTKEGKYSFILQPVNRLLMATKFYGLTLKPDKMFSSRVPTSREFVNMVGAGITSVTIGNTQDARDEDCYRAAKQLEEANILNVVDLQKQS